MSKSRASKLNDDFPDDVDVSVIIANPKERKHYPLTGYSGITDMGQPVFMLEVGQPKKFEDKRDADIPGQTDFEDFPEVLP